MWMILTGLAGWGAAHVALGQLKRYRESPTVVTLDKDFRSWNSSRPAVTACQLNRTDQTKVEKVIRQIWSVDPADELFEYYARFVRTVAYATLLNMADFEEFAEDESLDIDLKQLAMDVKPGTNMKTIISDVGEPALFNWIPVMTELGICYSINSLAIEDTALIKVHSNDTMFYPLTCAYGGTSSCLVMMEVDDHYDFYYHSPYDIVDITTPHFNVFSNVKTDIELSVSETVCGRGVRDLSSSRRACLFTDEPRGMKKVYSTNACRQSCRSRLALKLCKCIPFFYSADDGPVCTPAGMACVAQFTHNLTSLRGHKCICTSQCLYSVFGEIGQESQYWGAGLFGAKGHLKFTVQPPKVRYIREIVFHFQDLVVSFGGAAGLFLGASFISFVEVVYFLVEHILGTTSTQTAPSSSIKEKEQKLTYEAWRVQELTEILKGKGNRRSVPVLSI